MSEMEIVYLPKRTTHVYCAAACGNFDCNWVKRPRNQPYYYSFSLYPAPHQPCHQIETHEPAQPNTSYYCSKECATKKIN